MCCRIPRLDLSDRGGPQGAEESHVNNRSRVAGQDTTNSTAPGTVASFVRFVVFGGGTGLASSAALVALNGTLPLVVTNAVVTAAGTVPATELHSRFSFRAGRAN